MDKYLLEILKNVNTIIIPGLGALTITNHDTGEIMFMSYLKHDDGKLVNYIVENEGMEELEAKNLIAKYVREIQLTVDKGESYDMFQFGSFFKNDDEIDFKNWDKNNPTSKSKAAEEKEIISSPVVEKAPITKEELTETKSSEIKTAKEDVTPKTEKVAEEKPIKKEKIEPVVVHLKDEEEEKPKKDFNILEKEEQKATAEKLEILRKNQDSKKEKKKKGAGFWMLLVLLVLLGSGGVYFGLNYDKLKQHVPFLADKEIVEEPIVTDNSENSTKELENTTEEADSEPIEEVVPEEMEEPSETETKEAVIETSNSNSNLPFHIIAGAFSSEENAKRLGEKLKVEGYNVKVGPGRGMTLVSIKSFATRSEAQSGLNELKSVAPNGWVYEWK